MQSTDFWNVTSCSLVEVYVSEEHTPFSGPKSKADKHSEPRISDTGLERMPEGTTGTIGRVTGVSPENGHIYEERWEKTV
jgi:hypothetical protein